jgi:myo-inositol-1(or 4)-monophosphatase
LSTLPQYLAAAEQAARAGGAVLLDWADRFDVREKGPSDLVTQADLASQEAIRAVLLAEFPQHALVGEESEGRQGLASEYCWVVDPLDGTTNYVHRLPHYAVSIALLDHGEPVVGVVLDPMHDECFTAVRGEGAWLNSRPMRTSSVQDLARALVAASFAAKVKRGSTEVDQFVAAALNCQAVRRTGSAALNLAYLAAGRFDAFWALSTHVWDIAAGVLMVEEAGGVATSLDGGKLEMAVPHPVATANPALHRQFLDLLQNARPLG